MSYAKQMLKTSLIVDNYFTFYHNVAVPCVSKCFVINQSVLLNFLTFHIHLVCQLIHLQPIPPFSLDGSKYFAYLQSEIKS